MRRRSSSNILPRVRLGIFLSVEGEREAEVYYQLLLNEGKRGFGRLAEHLFI